MTGKLLVKCDECGDDLKLSLRHFQVTIYDETKTAKIEIWRFCPNCKKEIEIELPMTEIGI